MRKELYCYKEGSWLVLDVTANKPAHASARTAPLEILLFSALMLNGIERDRLRHLGPAGVSEIVTNSYCG